MPPKSTLTAFEIRFWSKVEKTDTCWLWNASIKSNGYGQFSGQGHPLYAHRVAYELAHGPIGPHLTVDHLCRVRRCVNPSHLEVVTMAENIRRGMSASAQNLRKTHCNRGHPFNGGNLRIDRRGRVCLACVRRRSRARYATHRTPD